MYLSYTIDKINRKQDELLHLTNMVQSYHHDVLVKMDTKMKNQNGQPVDWSIYTSTIIQPMVKPNPLKDNLYKKLVLLTHPDKTDNQENIKDFNSATMVARQRQYIRSLSK